MPYKTQYENILALILYSIFIAEENDSVAFQNKIHVYVKKFAKIISNTADIKHVHKKARSPKKPVLFENSRKVYTGFSLRVTVDKSHNGECVPLAAMPKVWQNFAKKSRNMPTYNCEIWYLLDETTVCYIILYILISYDRFNTNHKS